ncbi:MAG TPA: hypothetical protein VD788_12860 [Candidatus Polarisedimenticolaceae bacterium]|nr:hypothetical protein [Candidatus Polarisedimenticolaceae bacterium]
MKMPRAILLGPQRFRPNVAAALDWLGRDGPLALVSAGWQEREDEIDEFVEHCRREVVPLGLYHRAERALARDELLTAALRERQDQLRELQGLYRVRLASLLEAARSLMRRGDGRFVDEHRKAAIRAVRTLDRQHLVRIREIHDEFERRVRPGAHPSVRAEREELQQLVGRCSVIAIAGGHVAVLLNRLRLFDVLGLAADRPVVAWSAGAMALGERVILFHDSPPQGPGDAEVFEPGLGLYRGLVPLPHASERLALDDPLRVALFSRRFAPASSVTLEYGSRVDWSGDRWVARGEVGLLGRSGRLRRMRPD